MASRSGGGEERRRLDRCGATSPPQVARAEAFDRGPLFRLAWDASISAFAGRQVLYERFFFGDPVRMAGALVTSHGGQIQEYAEKVRAFVREGKDEAFAAASNSASTAGSAPR